MAKTARYSAKDLKNLGILRENSAEGLGFRRERCWEYVSMRIHLKRCRIFPLKVATILLNEGFKEGHRWSTVVT